MSYSLDGNDPQILQDFLSDLISEVTRPEETELLVEVFLTIQPPSRGTRSTLSPAIPINRPAPRKQGQAG